MKAKLITVAVYLGLCFLMFSCVEGEFYEKETLEETLEQEFGEQENELNVYDQNQDADLQVDIQADIDVQATINIQSSFQADNLQTTINGDGDVVYTTVEGREIIIADAGTTNTNTDHGSSEDGDLDNILDQDVVNSPDQDNTNVGDETLPNDLAGQNNETSNDTEVTNEESTTTSENQEQNNTDNQTPSEDSSEEESNGDGEAPNIVTEINETEPNATEVNDSRPSQERPSQERPSQEQPEENTEEDSTADNGGDTGSDTTADNGGDTGSDTTTDNGGNTGTGTSTGNGGNAGSDSNGEQSASEEGNDDAEEDGDYVTIPDENLDFVEDVEDSVNGDQFICNPFEGENQTSFQGIAGFVYDGLSHPFRKVQDYYDFGKRSDTPIFMSEINVPTRRFSEGFELNNGELVLNDMGGKLFEYFALDLRGRIKLGELEEEGHYQFAVISDDGSIFELEMDDNNRAELINNDRYTPTRMKCAAEPVYFGRNTVRDFQMKYFQGPRMHIALMLLWRKVDPEAMADEKYCDRSGNGLFFDFNKVPSEPKSAYTELQERGWKVLDSQNFLLPTGLVENPCGNDQQEPEVKCFSEQVVLDGRNWFYLNDDGIDMDSVKIEDEYGNEIRYRYNRRSEKMKLRRRCGYGSKFRISYCMEE